MQQFANNASSSLDGPIDDIVTALDVVDGSVFPATGNYRLIIGGEILECTGRSGNTLTVVRGQEGTAATSHVDEATVEHVLTKESLELFVQEYNQIGPWASRPATARVGTTYRATDLLNCLYRYNGTNWDMIEPVSVPNSLKADFSGWTQENFSTWSTSYKNELFVIDASTSQSNNWRGWRKTAPATPNSIELIFSPAVYFNSELLLSVGYRDTVSGRLHMLGIRPVGLNSEEIRVYTSPVFTSIGSAASFSSTGGRSCSIKVTNDGTDMRFYISRDRLSYTLLSVGASNSYLTNNQDEWVVLGLRNTITTGNTNYDLKIFGVKEN